MYEGIYHKVLKSDDHEIETNQYVAVFEEEGSTFLTRLRKVQGTEKEFIPAESRGNTVLIRISKQLPSVTPIDLLAPGEVRTGFVFKPVCTQGKLGNLEFDLRNEAKLRLHCYKIRNFDFMFS